MKKIIVTLCVIHFAFLSSAMNRNHSATFHSSPVLVTKYSDSVQAKKYSEAIQLIFKTCSTAENTFMEAYNSGDIEKIKQTSILFKEIVEEQLNTLEILGDFEENLSLYSTLKKILLFYQLEIEDTQIILDYYMSVEAFNSIKNTVEQMDQSKLTQDDVDKFNSAVQNMNEKKAFYNVMKSRNNIMRPNHMNELNYAQGVFLNIYGTD